MSEIGDRESADGSGPAEGRDPEAEFARCVERGILQGAVSGLLSSLPRHAAETALGLGVRAAGIGGGGGGGSGVGSGAGACGNGGVGGAQQSQHAEAAAVWAENVEQVLAMTMRFLFDEAAAAAAAPAPSADDAPTDPAAWLAEQAQQAQQQATGQAGSPPDLPLMSATLQLLQMLGVLPLGFSTAEHEPDWAVVRTGFGAYCEAQKVPSGAARGVSAESLAQLPHAAGGVSGKHHADDGGGPGLWAAPGVMGGAVGISPTAANGGSSSGGSGGAANSNGGSTSAAGGGVDEEAEDLPRLELDGGLYWSALRPCSMLKVLSW